MAIALTGATAAYAANSEDAPAGTAQAKTGSDISSGDIIVTAQRREEKARDVPMSITAVSGETLVKSGIVSTLDLGKISPGVELPLYGAFVLPSIRGISSSGAGVGDSPNVAIYVDGVYQASQSAMNADLPDVADVQILKGPQGSLYGQNAAGGAIIIDTVAPSFTWKGKFSASYGNMNDRNVNGYIAGPLTNTLAFELAASFHNRDGYDLNLLTGRYDQGLRSDSVRGKLLWQPTDNASLLVEGFYTRHADTGIYSSGAVNGNSTGNGLCAAGYVNCAGLPLATRPYTYSTNIQPDTIARAYGGSAHGKVEFDNAGTLSEVTSLNNVQSSYQSDVDSSPVNIASFFFAVPEHDFVQEINFASKKFSGFSFNAGVFYMSKTESYAPLITDVGGTPYTVYPADPLSAPGSYQYGSVTRYEKHSYAGYLELNYDVTPKLSIQAAGRYADETALVYSSTIYSSAVPLPSPQVDPRGSFSFKRFTPKAVLRYKPDDNNTFYASYSQGFKSGYVDTTNINVCNLVAGNTPACIDPPVKPETVYALEVGYKGKIGDTLDLNLAAFHYLYKDIQVFTYDPPAVGIYQNAAAGKINGFEFDGAWRATHELTLKLAGTYLDAKYTNFPFAEAYVPTGFGNTAEQMNVSGNPLMRTAKWTFNGSLDYRKTIAAGEFELFTNATYNSGYSFDVNNRVRQGAYTLIDGEISFAPSGLPGSRFVIWGKNLSNRAILQSVLESQLGDAGSYAPPRAFGVRAEYKF
jgi:iron complex outermembrane receptor protein